MSYEQASATRDKHVAELEEMTKAHVGGYTRKDGTYVKEHDDSRAATVRPQSPKLKFGSGFTGHVSNIERAIHSGDKKAIQKVIEHINELHDGKEPPSGSSAAKTLKYAKEALLHLGDDHADEEKVITAASRRKKLAVMRKPE